MTAHDWRLVPAAGGALAGAILGTGGHTIWLLAPSLAVAIMLPCLPHRRWIAVGVAMLVVVGVSAGAQQALRAGSLLAGFASDRAIVTAEVRVVSEPEPRPPRPPLPASATAMGEVRWVSGRGEEAAQRLPVVLVANGDQREELLALETGGNYLLRVRLAPTERGDASVAIVRVLEVLDRRGRPGSLQRMANLLRAGLRDAVADNREPQRALVPSLVVGDTSRISRAMDDDFRATGLTHLMAVSGANLALMLAVVLGLLRHLGVRGWLVRGASVVVVVCFVVICGPEPSVRRAAVMGLVGVAAIGAGLGRRSLRSLAVAVIVLMGMDPWLGRAAGFWLSCAACLGIILVAPVFVRALTRWLPRWLADSVAIPLSAQLSTQPIVTALNGEISLVGVGSNLLAAPFVGPTTVLGFAAACLSPLSAVVPVASPLGWLAGWSAQPILWIAEHGARMQGATVGWQASWVGIAVLVAVCVALGTLLPLLLARAWTSMLLAVLVTLALTVRPTMPGWPGAWQVAFCDVGQGDATAVRVAPHTAILVDTGPDSHGVLRCLAGLGVREVPMVVLSHLHADHVGGFAAVAQQYRPEVVVLGQAHGPPSVLASVRSVAGPTARFHVTSAGEELAIGDARWRTVASWVPADTGVAPAGESSAENDASVVGIVQVGELSVLLPGDLEPEGQRAALRTASVTGAGLDSMVLKLPHHGSSRQEPRFLAATGARLAVVSAGADNEYGHPAPRTVSLARQHGMRVVRTDEQGTITVAVVDGALQVRTSG